MHCCCCCCLLTCLQSPLDEWEIKALHSTRRKLFYTLCLLQSGGKSWTNKVRQAGLNLSVIPVTHFDIFSKLLLFVCLQAVPLFQQVLLPSCCTELMQLLLACGCHSDCGPCWMTATVDRTQRWPCRQFAQLIHNDLVAELHSAVQWCAADAFMSSPISTQLVGRALAPVKV